MGAIPFLFQIEPENGRYVGAYIKHLRTGLGMTQPQLAFESGYSVVTISRIETGKANALGVAGRDILSKLAKMYGFNDASDLLDDYSSFVTSEDIIFEPLQ